MFYLPHTLFLALSLSLASLLVRSPHRPQTTSTIMNAATKKTKAATKRADRSVPFDEMRRLMQVYGSIKCLRKRQTPSGAENTKIDSVKRKFYRWFPDLEERFEKDEEGFYRPKFGHEFEMRFREDMRTKDGEILTKKRARCRKQRHGGINAVKAASTDAKQAFTSSFLANTTASFLTDCTPVSLHAVSPAPSFSDQEATKDEKTGIKLEFDHDPMASASITADTEPLDRSFIAEKGIFDDVEKSFYGSFGQDFPSIQFSSCISSLEEQDYSRSWETDSSSIEDMLGRSIEECCEEILMSDDNDSVSGYLFDVISS